MNNFRTNEQEQKKVEKISRQYLSKEENKMEQLQKLDRKVKTPGKIAACVLGVAGALVMGAGMSLVMVWDVMGAGLALSIPGMVAALLAYPVYARITSRRKKKYAAEVLRLSNELMG